jgi:hypothetical protein
MVNKRLLEVLTITLLLAVAVLGNTNDLEFDNGIIVLNHDTIDATLKK